MRRIYQIVVMMSCTMRSNNKNKRNNRDWQNNKFKLFQSIGIVKEMELMNNAQFA